MNYYIKYHNRDNPSAYTIWETKEDLSEERCIFPSDFTPQGWVIFVCDDSDLNEINILTPEELFLELV